MRKIIAAILVIVCTFSLVGCGRKEPKPVYDEYANHKKVFSLITNYEVKDTKGFDYSLEQKFNNTVVNAHNIVIRLDNSNGIIGSRIEYKKSLISDISKSQYTEINATAYYKDNKIATNIGDNWSWKNCSFEEFAGIKINSFNFNVDKVKNLNLITSGKYSVLTFNIEDSETTSFLGVSSNIKDLKFEIKTNPSYDKLVSFVISYSQNMTSTEFKFIPYYGSVNVDIPI